MSNARNARGASDRGEAKFVRRRPALRRQRRSLSHLGGPTVTSGDRRTARDLAAALETGVHTGREFTHGFHAYPARMHPLTAWRVLAAHAVGSGSVVLDPFCGSGTVAVEALRTGAEFVGGDVSPLAIEIAWARTRGWSSAQIARMVSIAARVARRAGDRAIDVPVPPGWPSAETEWYDAPALRDLWALRECVLGEADPQMRRVLRAALSSIVVKVSRQASDATTVRDRAHRPVRAGVAIRLFRSRTRELARQMHALQQDLRRRGVRRVEPRFVQADARNGGLVSPGTASLVLTSPPYLGTYDYLLHHARRYALLDLPVDFADRHEIGSRRKAARGAGEAAVTYERDLRMALGQMRDAIAPGGRIVLLLGDGVLRDRIVRADEMVRRLAAPAGLAVVAMASQARPDWLGGRGAASRREHLIELARIDRGPEP